MFSVSRAASFLALAAGSFCLSAALAGCSSLPVTAVHSTAHGSIAYSLTGAGQAHPVIVLQSGLGDGRNTWSTIVETLASKHTVFAYDRPGYGESPDTDDPRDACSVARELHALLKAEKITPPYLLVGHSLGGQYQYAFAKLYPSEVAGLVLIDPTHPKHWQRMQEDAPALAAIVSGLRKTVFTSAMRREFDDQEKSSAQLASLPPPRKPAIILTRTRYELMERGAFENMSHSLAQDWVSLLGTARLESVEDSGHYIHKDRPDRVIAAIGAVFAQSHTTAK